MAKSLFLAGASGVIGRRLAQILIADGWRVIGTTRSRENACALRAIGVEPAVLNVFNAREVNSEIAKARPDVVIHQLSDLPDGLDPSKMRDAVVRNARIRVDGTRNLVASSIDAGVRRLIAQSLAFVYADGALPHHEDDPLDVSADGDLGVTARGVASLERQVLQAPLEGIVLRYGLFYGPGTGFDRPAGAIPVHIDAAAKATALAVTEAPPGIYNVADPNSIVSSNKAQRMIGWNSGWRIGLD